MTFPLHFKTHSREIEHFARFTLVGLLGTVVDFTVLIVLKEAFGLPLLLANTLSYSAGIANNFTLNRWWTYPDARRKALWAQFGQFLIISTIGLLLNNSLVGVLNAPLSQLLNSPQMGYLAAKVVATLVVLFWNFFANRNWTFNDAQ